jgi:hypothetical protein
LKAKKYFVDMSEFGGLGVLASLLQRHFQHVGMFF